MWRKTGCRCVIGPFCVCFYLAWISLYQCFPRLCRIMVVSNQPRALLSPELGGKNPVIVYDSADLDSAVEGVVDAIWFNQGQVSVSGHFAVRRQCELARHRSITCGE